MNKTGSKKKQFILFGVCSFLALVLCLVTLVVTVKNVEKEENKNQGVATNKNFEDFCLMENEKNDLLCYISALTGMAVDTKFVKADVFTDVSIDDSSVVINGEQNGADVELFLFFKNKLLEKTDALYGEDYIGEFGVINENLPQIVLPMDTDAHCNMTVGLADSEGNPVYDDNGSVVDEDYYFLTFTKNGNELNAEESVAFGLENIPSVREEVVKMLSSECKVKSLSVEPQDFQINAKSGVYTDCLDYVEYEYVYKINADVEFVNTLAVFGEKEISFEYTITRRYEYSFAGVTLSAKELYLEVGEEAQLNVNAVMEDDSDYSIKFISSDESKVTVDEMGYVTALAESDEPVSVVVELEYLGEKFHDECFVYAGIQKES